MTVSVFCFIIVVVIESIATLRAQGNKPKKNCKYRKGDGMVKTKINAEKAGESIKVLNKVNLAITKKKQYRKLSWNGCLKT